MAKFSGHRCDRPGCTVSAETEGNELHPAGWIVIKPVTPVDRGAAEFELCSNACGAKFMKERADLDREVGGTKRTISEEGKASMQAGNLTRWHREGAHEQEPREDCPLCQAATEPAGGQ